MTFGRRSQQLLVIVTKTDRKLESARKSIDTVSRVVVIIPLEDMDEWKYAMGTDRQRGNSTKFLQGISFNDRCSRSAVASD